MTEGKIIEIRRHYNFIEAVQQADPAVKEWFDSAWKAVGPYWDKTAKASASGLSWKEKQLLMPKLHNVEAEDREFRKATDEYFDQILTPIPADGLKLQIGLEDDSKPLSETNRPINAKDYVTYRHLIGHPDVADTQQLAESLPHKKFYIFDKEATTDSQVSINKLEDQATEIYFEVRNTPEKVEQILTLMGVKTAKLEADEKVLKLKEFSRANKSKDPSVQERALKSFIATATSKDMDLEYMITELLSGQILERVGTTILVKESGDSLGDSLREAVIFLKNPKNSKTLTFLKNSQKQLLKEKV